MSLTQLVFDGPWAWTSWPDAPAPPAQGSWTFPQAAYLLLAASSSNDNLGFQRCTSDQDFSADAGSEAGKALGVTPLQFAQRPRVARAVHLLETTNHSVDEVAAQVGHAEQANFAQLTKRSRWRQARRE